MYDIRRMQMLLEIHERGTIISAAHALNLTHQLSPSRSLTSKKKQEPPCSNA